MVDPRLMQEWLNLDDLGIQLSPMVLPTDDLAVLGIHVQADAEPALPNCKPAA